ncbi:MAG: hypothetical protein HY541_07225, partial [Deltaproteobacteria bacterium]|nr:hypothetical protein [Deltaproteobacteria bacterium]
MVHKGRGKENQPKQFPPTVVLFVFCLLAGLIYSNTFSNPFLFDDTGNIEGNPLIRDLANFLNLSGTRYVGYLTFALNYQFGGLNVFGYHLVNLLIHIANGFLVYWLVVLLVRVFPSPFPPPPGGRGRGEGIALIAALLFIVHPIQTQAVTYIVQRFASLVTLFYLLAVVCYLKWRLFGETTDQGPGTRDQKLQVTGHGSPVTGLFKRSRVWYVASLLSTLLAMKTKENSFTLPLMILLVEWIFFRRITRKQWLILIPFLLTLFIIPLSLSYQEPSTVVDPTRMDIPTLSRWE